MMLIKLTCLIGALFVMASAAPMSEMHPPEGTGLFQFVPVFLNPIDILGGVMGSLGQMFGAAQTTVQNNVQQTFGPVLNTLNSALSTALSSTHGPVLGPAPSPTPSPTPSPALGLQLGSQRGPTPVITPVLKPVLTPGPQLAPTLTVGPVQQNLAKTIPQNTDKGEKSFTKFDRFFRGKCLIFPFFNFLILFVHESGQTGQPNSSATVHTQSLQAATHAGPPKPEHHLLGFRLDPGPRFNVY